MAEPEEFTIHIEPDGRIVLDGAGMHETSFRRIIQLLEETVGPVRQLDVSTDPPGMHLNPTRSSRSKQDDKKDLEIRRG